MYDLLVQFKEREAHTKVPTEHIEDGKNLAIWLQTQKTLKRKGTLASDREKKLEKLGVSWFSPHKPWEEMYDLLVQFKEREGHTKVLQHHKEDDQNLGRWLSNQRTLQRKGTIAVDRQKKLEELGVDKGCTRA